MTDCRELGQPPNSSQRQLGGEHFHSAPLCAVYLFLELNINGFLILSYACLRFVHGK